MDWASWINVALSGAMLWLTIAILKLNKTMTKIAEDDKLEKTGHDLSITLPTLYLGKNENTGVLNNFCIINHKNKMEAIYRIYAKEQGNDKELGFWIADKEPIMISPYSCSYVTKNVTPSLKMFDIDKIELYAITNDCTVKLNKNIDCFNKPMEAKKE